MANLEELPEEPELPEPETPEAKAARLRKLRLDNMARGRVTAAQNRARQSRAGSSPPSSGPAKSSSRQIHDTFAEGAGTLGTGLLTAAPLTGALLGGSTDRTAPSARPKTPEERAEAVGNLMARAAEESPVLLKLLMIFLHYGIWAEIAVFLIDLGLAAGMDSKLIPPDSWLGLLAYRRLRDVIATLEKEAQNAGSVAPAVPANGAGRPLRWQPEPAYSPS